MERWGDSEILRGKSQQNKLIELYGADFGLIQAYFPERSRKQIRRKYQEMEQRYGKRMHRIEMRRDEERRKNFFDQEILESNMIKWPKKPNIAESSSSEDSLWWRLSHLS